MDSMDHAMMGKETSGGFLGHTCSGLAFLLLGGWLSYHTASGWWRAKASGHHYTSMVSHQEGWSWPWETIVKIGVTLAYALGEVLTGCCDGGSFLNNGQHITMCGLFLLNGLADLLAFYRVPSPNHLQHLTASAAFWGESFLFTNHTHGMSALFQHTHSLLYLPSYSAAVVILVEAAKPRLWLLAALRNVGITLHGSWLMQSAFILYSEQVSLPRWTEDDTMMLLPMLFTWHLLGCLLLQGVCLLITRKQISTTTKDHAYSRYG